MVQHQKCIKKDVPCAVRPKFKPNIVKTFNSGTVHACSDRNSTLNTFRPTKHHSFQAWGHLNHLIYQGLPHNPIQPGGDRLTSRDRGRNKYQKHAPRDTRLVLVQDTIHDETCVLVLRMLSILVGYVRH